MSLLAKFFELFITLASNIQPSKYKIDHPCIGFLFKLQPLTQILYRFRADTFYFLQVITTTKGRPAAVVAADTLTIRNYCCGSTGTYLRQSHQRSRRGIVWVYSAFQLNCPRARRMGQARGLLRPETPGCKTTRKHYRDENSNHKREKLNPALPCVATFDKFISSHQVRRLTIITAITG